MLLSVESLSGGATDRSAGLSSLLTLFGHHAWLLIVFSGRPKARQSNSLGKLAMSCNDTLMRVFVVLVVVILTAVSAVEKVPAAELSVDLELVFAVDASGSVDQFEYVLQLAGIAAALKSPEVQRAIRSGPNRRIAVNLVVWAEARYPKESTGWMMIGSLADAEAAGARIADFPRHATGGTGLGDGLASAMRAFKESPFSGLRHVIDVSGDGRETTPREFAIRVPQARAMAAAQGVTVNGLAILTDDATLHHYYRKALQTGADSFVMSVASYDDFAEAMHRKLVREITHRPKISLRDDLTE